MATDTTLIDHLLKYYTSLEDVIGANGLIEQFTKPVLERAMQAELTYHLGYEKHDPKGQKRASDRLCKRSGLI